LEKKMKTAVFLLFAILAPTVIAAPSIDQQLQQLKASFPPKKVERVDITAKNSIEINVPNTDIWSAYRSSLQVATLQSAARTLDILEARIPNDLEALTLQHKNSGSHNQSAKAEAGRTINWINQQLKPHLAAWRKLFPRQK
jgi:hypothetical protein